MSDTKKQEGPWRLTHGLVWRDGQSIQTDKPAVGKRLCNALNEACLLREALLLYHEAWNGCGGNWRSAMRNASKNADAVLWDESG